MPDIDPYIEEKEMSFLDHLEALRWHLVRALIAVVIISVVVFSNKSFVFGTIIFGPKEGDFLTYQLLCRASAFLHMYFPKLISEDAICIGQHMPTLQNINMAGQFMTHIVVSLLGGLVVSFPYIVWEIWRFIKPALKQQERRFSRGIIFFTWFQFTLGILFGYYVIAPLSINFFMTYELTEQVVTMPTLSSYISILTTVVLACGIVFELPILVYFLSKLGILSPSLLRTYRKHAVVGSLILSAIITPPDVFSQLLVAGPILFLYEVSIFVSKIVEKQAEKA